MKQTQTHSPSLDEGSVVSGDEETVMPTPELEVHEPVRMAIRDAFQSMDVVDLGSELKKGLRDEDGSSLLEVGSSGARCRQFWKDMLWDRCQ